jgi:2,3-diketo-5-methylthiopentyl-1-phosphate enolase
MPDPRVDTREPSAPAVDIDPETHVIASYHWRTRPGADVVQEVRTIAELQSVGSPLGQSRVDPVARARHVARVLGLRPADGGVPDEEAGVASRGRRSSDWTFEIAYPAHNIGGQLPLLLTTVYGEAAALGELRLLDLRLPPSFVQGFVGPRFGIEGIRALIGAPRRPLLVVMIKPSLGLTPAESARVFYEAAMGGADAVKDDELCVDHPWSTFTERARTHRVAADRAYDETGRRTLYFVNITDRPDRLHENARRAVAAGATGLLVNHLAVGTAAVEALAEDPDVDVPILGHLATGAATWGGATAGLASHLVLAMLPRLAGVDAMILASPGGTLQTDHASFAREVAALREPLGDLRASLPVPGGGLTAGSVAGLVDKAGVDLAIGVGSAIHRHDRGTRAGTALVRAAIEAASDGSRALTGDRPSV